MYFRELEKMDLPDIKLLHKEWFPLNYPESYYEKLLKKKGIVALGAFIEIDLNDF